MLLASDDLEEALVVIRRGQRWLQGRREQRSWDANEDDREYDPEGLDRGEQTEQAESYPLEIPLRHRLALVRLRLGDDDEALVSPSVSSGIRYLKALNS
jgi:general transcription factor 3C polypeptide 3 (transcription factor C subunit 4)